MLRAVPEGRPMTEAEWLACADPHEMLEFFRGETSDRKLRLFAVAFSPEWRTDTAVSLAKQMYDARDFNAMPILADALQDAGCGSEEILDHCRRAGSHVRGCWVVDLVLGKA